MKISRIAFLAGLFAAGLAQAEGSPTDPAAIARENLMRTIGGSAKVLGDMAGGKAAFDAAGATAAKDALIAAAGSIPSVFETQGADDPESKAKPEIWTGWDGFVAKADALKAAATALDVASLEGTQAGMGAVGGVCKDCHSTYRE